MECQYMQYLGDMKALENLDNNSICVLECNGIRNTNCEYDLLKNLVFVSWKHTQVNGR